MATIILWDMKDKMMKYAFVLAVLFIVSVSAQAKHNSDPPLSPEDWKEIMERVVLLEDSGLLPTLLPVIMQHRDTLQLTDDQLAVFRAWRESNYTNVINLMGEILE